MPCWLTQTFPLHLPNLDWEVLQERLRAAGYDILVQQQGERQHWRMLISRPGERAMVLTGDGQLQAAQDQASEVNAIKRACLVPGCDGVPYQDVPSREA